jgi:hypothetical protein
MIRVVSVVASNRWFCFSILNDSSSFSSFKHSSNRLAVLVPSLARSEKRKEIKDCMEKLVGCEESDN